jgi:hypothetical protein
MMSSRTRRTAGLIFLLYPLIVLGGLVLLVLFQQHRSTETPGMLTSELYWAGYAQAATLLILALAMLRYVDDALLNERAKRYVRWSVPLSAFLISAGIFLSMIPPDRTGPSALIYLVYLGAVGVISGCAVLASGLMRR